MNDQINDNEAKSTSPGISPEIPCFQFSAEKWEPASCALPVEMAFTIYVNTQELVTILCTPVKLNQLVLGYLLGEGVISQLSDVAMMRVCADDSLADVKLNRTDFVLPQKRILTSGCGGGVSLGANLSHPAVVSDVKIAPEQALGLMKQMLEKAELYNQSGGIHTSALADASQVLVVGEDIGRHNTLDKINGECLLRKMATKDKILLTSGRISSEMLRKAVRMQVPVIVSLTSPTQRAVELAGESGITLAGYARGGRLRVYSVPERLGISVR